jgi:hypothetical protein
MVVIADCGSTKCDWLLVEDARDQRLENTKGFSPFFHSTDDIVGILSDQLLPKMGDKPVDTVWFYGTGIHDSDRAEIVKNALNNVFGNAKIEVEHDLLAAARACCQDRPGIACILGTGSNSCYYDGKVIVDNVPSLGWLLGDEGSGTHLGKALLRAWYYRSLPTDLKVAFETAHPEGPSVIKNKVYGKDANSYLASFTRFLGEHKQHPFVEDLVEKSFGAFIDAHVIKYQGCHSVPIHFVGSIAFHFQEVLNRALKARNLTLGTIIRKPVYPLADFHLNLLG